jgi:tetratricopeptide (TPR) repeat protein
VICQGNIGLCLQESGNIQQAVEAHKQALRLAENLGNESMTAAIWANLASCYRVLGNLHEAVTLCEQALEVHRRLGEVRMIGIDLDILGTASGHRRAGEGENLLRRSSAHSSCIWAFNR